MKIHRHAKKEETVSINQEENKPIKTDLKITEKWN